ncbi:MAG: [FeFe] hydrogenase H-cluster maturation GTPase HydF [Oscillospiraceae bacterium]
MVSEINQTPKALRLHIGVFGRTNAGKSTLINAISGHKTALTSPVAGTTTDPVYKPMELLPLGPVVFIDTAGLDDKSELGEIRVKKTMQQLTTCDAAILVISAKTTDFSEELKYISEIKKEGIPMLIVVNTFGDKNLSSEIYKQFGCKVIMLDIENGGIQLLKDAVIELLNDRIEEPALTANLVKKGDLVILTAPQDIQAPKGRLILPEVHVLRDLLDNGCMVMTVTSENIKRAFESLAVKPALVVTDSQIFKLVNETIPADIPLTSFSLLMAKIKADISKLVKGAQAIDDLENGDRVMILESCSHHPLDGDIAREKIPRWLKLYTGKELQIVNYSGQIIPEKLQGYKLAIHCGGCMVNRKSMLYKQKQFADAGVPLTNFGAAIAYMNGILNRVTY